MIRVSRLYTLFSYFLPERFIPVESPLPLDNVLTTRGSNRHDIGDRAILDGRIYNQSVRVFNSNESWIFTDLDWSNLPATRLFLKNLILLISAIALKQGTQSLKWMIAYPSNFSRNRRNLCVATWHDLTEEVAKLTGLSNQCPNNPKSTQFVPTTLAVGRYFYHHEQRSLEHATCIYLQENTTEIGVWQNDRLIHQCSINFAGRHLLADFLQLNPGFIARYFEKEIGEWKGLSEKWFYSKLNTLIRWEAEDWLKQKLPALAEVEEVRGLTSSMSLGVGGLYYYIGLTLKALRANGLLRRNQATPIYIGGSHAHLLHWLTSIGQFTAEADINRLLGDILCRSAGFPYTEINTHLSQKPKDEVAIGLVSGGRRLSGMDPKEPKLLVPGEAFEINRMSYPWNCSVEPDEVVTQFEIPEPDHLSDFLYVFHQAIEAVSTNKVVLHTAYTRSPKLEDNRTLWASMQPLIAQLVSENGLDRDARKMRSHPPFILTLQALLTHLSQKWAEKHTL